MGRIRPVALAFRAWWPMERGAPACWHGLAHTVLGRARNTCSAVVTVLWPRARRRFGAAVTIKAEEGQLPNKEARHGLTQNRGASVEQWGGATRWRSTAVEGSRWSLTTRP
jgi:hypothetical protein